MEVSEVKELDKYELVLEEKLTKLTDCQRERNYKSCRECGEFYECQIRKEYVDSVFSSMSKGEVGGFEF